MCIFIYTCIQYSNFGRYYALKFFTIFQIHKVVLFVIFFHRAEYMELEDKIYTNGDGQWP